MVQSSLKLRVGNNHEMQTIEQAKHMMKILVTHTGRREYRLVAASMDGNKSVFNVYYNHATKDTRVVSHDKNVHTDVVSGISYIPRMNSYVSTDRDGHVLFLAA